MSQARISRRRFIESIGGAALAGSATHVTSALGAQAERRQASGRATPRILHARRR